MVKNTRLRPQVILLTGPDIPDRLVNEIDRIVGFGGRLFHLSIKRGMEEGPEKAGAGNFCEALGDYLSRDEAWLCIVIGYSFDDRVMNGILTLAIERGVRVLVLDNDVQYKQLAERLGVSGIKHKVRIENMELGKWDENGRKLLSGILADELRRAGG